MRSSRLIVSAVSALLLFTAGGPARAEQLFYPTFDSGPAVISKGLSTNPIHDSTLIFGRQNMAGQSYGTIRTIARVPLGSAWTYGVSELISLAAHVDSDPAATYLPGNIKVLVCFHTTDATGRFYCSVGQPTYPLTGNKTPLGFSVDQSNEPVLTGNFPAGSSPAIVRTGNDVFLFGRGGDSQIWNAVATVPSGLPNWQGWFPPRSRSTAWAPSRCVLARLRAPSRALCATRVDRGALGSTPSRSLRCSDPSWCAHPTRFTSFSPRRAPGPISSGATICWGPSQRSGRRGLISARTSCQPPPHYRHRRRCGWSHAALTQSSITPTLNLSRGRRFRRGSREDGPRALNVASPDGHVVERCAPR
jgi:hypothetical protein